MGGFPRLSLVGVFSFSPPLSGCVRHDLVGRQGKITSDSCAHSGKLLFHQTSWETLLSKRSSKLEVLILQCNSGYGGISYISQLMGCHAHTIPLGLKELSDDQAMSTRGIRRPGGGGKKALEQIERLYEAFLRVVEAHTAGSPMDESLKWTHLTRQQIADLLAQEEEINVSVTVVDKLLKQHNFRRRKAFKTKATGDHPERKEQFEKIAALVEDYQGAGNPVMSVDTKKKELIGKLFRDGHAYTQKPIEVYDYDWPSLATGVVIPHGLYDMTHNIGYVRHVSIYK